MTAAKTTWGWRLPGLPDLVLRFLEPVTQRREIDLRQINYGHRLCWHTHTHDRSVERLGNFAHHDGNVGRVWIQFCTDSVSDGAKAVRSGCELDDDRVRFYGNVKRAHQSLVREKFPT